MLRIEKQIREIVGNNGSIKYKSTDNPVGQLRKAFYKLVFALAIASKVTPKRLANAFNSEKVQDFASKFRDELVKLEQKEREKVMRTAEKLVSNKK